MRATLASLAAAAVLAGCGYVSDYETSVYDEEPVYCYQSIGGGQLLRNAAPPRSAASRELFRPGAGTLHPAGSAAFGSVGPAARGQLLRP